MPSLTNIHTQLYVLYQCIPNCLTSHKEGLQIVTLDNVTL